MQILVQALEQGLQAAELENKSILLPIFVMDYELGMTLHFLMVGKTHRKKTL